MGRGRAMVGRAARLEQDVGRRFSRRAVLGLAAGRVGWGRSGSRLAVGEQRTSLVVSAEPEPDGVRAFRPADFGFVGVYDVDWLLQPEFGRLLDNLAASPEAFRGVRFFGSFTAGSREAMRPESRGVVWENPDAPRDFSLPFRALEALTSRGLTPFVVLGFFPPAVSPSPVAPPESWDNWKVLVRSFLSELAADPRFGAGAMRDWWFEVWNEPNEGRFWSGSAEQYLALYRATAEAVRLSGVPVWLGGPAMSYKPEAGARYGQPWLSRFLRFLVAEPEVQCDFVSVHRKGTVDASEPDVRRLVAAAVETAELALSIDAGRFAGLTFLNDEADEKVGFEVPYAPRLDHRNAAWLAAVASAHAGLTERYRGSGIRFLAAADNANLQLVEAPFEGRRSIMTRARTGVATDLLKLPAFGFYEMVRVLGQRQGSVVAGDELCYPTTDLFHVVTADADRFAAMLTFYPTPGSGDQGPRTIDYVVRDIPWRKVNVARFQIDLMRSNAYTAAGGSPANPYPVPTARSLAEIRQRQELGLFAPIRRGIALPDATYRETLTIAPYATVCLWITPAIPDPPAAPRWLETTVEAGNVVLRWTPNREPYLFGYEVYLLDTGAPSLLLSPNPQRAALWIDTAPPPGRRVYGVRAVTASGVVGAIVESGPVDV